MNVDLRSTFINQWESIKKKQRTYINTKRKKRGKKDEERIASKMTISTKATISRSEINVHIFVDVSQVSGMIIIIIIVTEQ